MKNSIKHVAIIMDGNGRWATDKKHTRVWGHVRGSAKVSEIVEEADNLGIKALTLYAFSTENWSRPQLEVKTLFLLLKKFLKKESARIIKNNINFKVVGDYSGLPQDTQELIVNLEKTTQEFTGLKLRFAFNYGGRREIVDAVNKIINEKKVNVTEADFDKYLYAPECGDVDLMIRTGGDSRISNFLLWQNAYAELFFTKTKWPDFTPADFRKIIEVFEGTNRRFGNVQSEIDLKTSQIKAQVNQESLSESIHV
ncbi:MAG: polyprenyl diphosphate synthase [Bacteriovoracaceae bacterium]